MYKRQVLSFRLRERPAKIVAALGTLVVSFVYLIAQMVGAGVLLQALAGIDFTLSVLITGTFMLIYVLFGGMLATTWVQIIKAGLLMSAGIVLTVLVLSKVGFNRSSCSSAPQPSTPRRTATWPPAFSTRTRSTRSPSGSRCCSAPPGCRTC